MVSLKINDKHYEISDKMTVLEACKLVNIPIPTLCYDERLKANHSCNLCVVEIKGQDSLQNSCILPVKEGMEILTESKKVISARKEVLNDLYKKRPHAFSNNFRSFGDKIYEYSKQYGIPYGEDTEEKEYPLFDKSPFYYYDANKCIGCKLCIQLCEELQGNGCLKLDENGIAQVDSTHKIYCEECGNCIHVCPTGAFIPKPYLTEFAKMDFEVPKQIGVKEELKNVKTTCSYCGVGCQLELTVKENRVVGSKPVKVLPNNGLLCVKGSFGYKFINHPDRLKTPLIKRNGKLEESSWEEAYNLIISKAKEYQDQYGGDVFAGMTSARCTNEENYLFQKLFRAGFHTNNIDHCARLCHSSSVVGLSTTLGSGAMTNSIEEIKDNDVIFVIGSNTTENHPVIGTMMRQAKKKGAKFIIADPREIDLTRDADIHLQIRPGTNIALINAMAHVIIKNNLYDKKYIEERVENFDEFVDHIKNYTPEKSAEICGISSELIINAAKMYGEAENAGIYYAMGITQHVSGSQSVMTLSNLALICGNVGKANAGVNPLRGQNNVQGACDMGGLPDVYPGYQKVTSQEIRNKFEKAWNVKLSDKKGITLQEVIHNAGNGSIKFLYIMGENPMITEPDLKNTEKDLRNAEFLVVQDIFLSETAALADVVLPASSFAEKDGTFTNTERRVQRVRQAIEPIGYSKPDWIILMELLQRLGFDKTYEHPSEIMEEIAKLTPEYAGVTYEKIEQVGIQWPVLDQGHQGTKFLHAETFPRKNGKALLVPVDNVSSSELTDEKYPYVMTTGRILFQYHSRTMTGRVEELNKKAPQSYLEMNPTTANKLGLKDEQEVKVTSRRGSVITKLKVTDKISDEVLFMTFHYSDARVNYLTNPEVDPIAKIPELKVAAVNIENTYML
ncbi:MAG: formate dehydrogenase subunit alpha [Sedimentibacter sp.]